MDIRGCKALLANNLPEWSAPGRTAGTVANETNRPPVREHPVASRDIYRHQPSLQEAELNPKVFGVVDRHPRPRVVAPRYGVISDDQNSVLSRERCVQLFAELGKKIDRIAAYLRTQQRKASIAAEEAQRLQQRRRSAEQRVSDVKEMLTYFMRCRGLKRLEGELNTIRLQSELATVTPDRRLGTARRSSVCIPEAFRIAFERDAGASARRAERRIPAGHDQHPAESLRMVRDALLRGESVTGARLERGCHIRIE